MGTNQRNFLLFTPQLQILWGISDLKEQNCYFLFPTVFYYSIRNCKFFGESLSLKERTVMSFFKLFFYDVLPHTLCLNSKTGYHVVCHAGCHVVCHAGCRGGCLAVCHVGCVMLAVMWGVSCRLLCTVCHAGCHVGCIMRAAVLGVMRAAICGVSYGLPYVGLSCGLPYVGFHAGCHLIIIEASRVRQN